MLGKYGFDVALYRCQVGGIWAAIVTGFGCHTLQDGRPFSNNGAHCLGCLACCLLFLCLALCFCLGVFLSLSACLGFCLGAFFCLFEVVPYVVIFGHHCLKLFRVSSLVGVQGDAIRTEQLF